MLTLREAKNAFFKASLQGWAGGAKKISISELPGYKVIIWEEDDWRFVDMYFKISNSLDSYGTTTGWFRGVPIFFMSYGGWYDEEVVPFLKQVLKISYEKGEFFGGRGPACYIDYEAGLVYENHQNRISAGSFDGWEEVRDLRSGKRRGYHEYWGRFIYNESFNPLLMKKDEL